VWDRVAMRVVAEGPNVPNASRAHGINDIQAV